MMLLVSPPNSTVSALRAAPGSVDAVARSGGNGEPLVVAEPLRLEPTMLNFDRWGSAASVLLATAAARS